MNSAPLSVQANGAAFMLSAEGKSYADGGSSSEPRRGCSGAVSRSVNIILPLPSRAQMWAQVLAWVRRLALTYPIAAAQSVTRAGQPNGTLLA